MPDGSATAEKPPVEQIPITPKPEQVVGAATVAAQKRHGLLSRLVEKFSRKKQDKEPPKQDLPPAQPIVPSKNPDISALPAKKEAISIEKELTPTAGFGLSQEQWLKWIQESGVSLSARRNLQQAIERDSGTDPTMLPPTILERVKEVTRNALGGKP